MSGLPLKASVPAVCFDLRNVQVHLGSSGRLHALTDIYLRIQAGERVALVGANGSGKSTMLRTLHSLQSISGGELHASSQQRVAMLFQRPHMLRLSARLNIQLGLWLKGVAWGETRALALAALDRVELGHIAERNARALSGGQQQRVALARAWALRPDVWLLDEPTASLDPHAKREVEALIAEFTTRPEHGTPERAPTLVFSSHNLGQVKRLASRVIYLEQGRLLADLPVADFFNHDLLRSLCPQAHLFVQGESL
ncbi:ATP-binding cassette domain-containing protein [Hydrogenophaga sp. PBL-H3]|uniref:ATP-binding cassette domain-containing protein n=1 Tax=Hydrogenophaga sp. PBL-H3 TaxID=434010 RepID=UPI00132004E7|nr:ATP-binding cassette domain-containing protein [Hydrogenophaga sp. PBL-H3]QHE77166.1 ATP-binding cassette domain-containing protein [Hydrogenophaga sp. PBL-H3]QHE81590.1 ATP-binding cassette domain-containing protein [Hydrogenophaga sp. PBL-H3]